MKPALQFPGSFAVISDEVAQEPGALRAFMRDFQLPAVELRSFAGRAFRDLTDTDVAEFGAVARGEGWRVCGCATPVYKCALGDRRSIVAHREIFCRSLEVARALGCDLVRVFTFQRENDVLPSDSLARIREHLRALVDLATGSGVRIGIENEHSCRAATVGEVLAVVRDLPPEVGVIWDPANVLYLPGATPPIPTDVARLASRLCHVHAKDAVRRVARAPAAAAAADSVLPALATPIGDGEIDWAAQLRALRDIGYGGLVSLETHWRAQPVDESLLHLPAGFAFSEGGDAASRVCMAALAARAETLKPETPA